MDIEPAAIRDVGGFEISATPRHPAGRLRGGGYDPDENILYLGPGGHPDGMAKAGGIPDPERTPGISIFETLESLYWANDSMSLNLPLTPLQCHAVQRGLEEAFSDKPIVQVDGIGNAFG